MDAKISLTNNTFKVYTWAQLNQKFFKKENVAVHHCGFKLKCSKHLLLFWPNFGKLYQCNSSYAKLEQHLIKCICPSQCVLTKIP